MLRWNASGMFDECSHPKVKLSPTEILLLNLQKAGPWDTQELLVSALTSELTHHTIYAPRFDLFLCGHGVERTGILA
jgi:hypothetical protein